VTWPVTSGDVAGDVALVSAVGVTFDR
jgi:hypothetical protein